ncbi:hypothetical protein AAMO2058_000115500 [Amorphochlora amoebiformis]
MATACNASDRQHNSARYLRRRTVCNGRKLSSLNNRGTDVDLFCIDARVVPSWGRFWYRKPDSIVTMNQRYRYTNHSYFGLYTNQLVFYRCVRQNVYSLYLALDITIKLVAKFNGGDDSDYGTSELKSSLTSRCARQVPIKLVNIHVPQPLSMTSPQFRWQTVQELDANNNFVPVASASDGLYPCKRPRETQVLLAIVHENRIFSFHYIMNLMLLLPHSNSH